MSDEVQTVDLPSESETSQVESPVENETEEAVEGQEETQPLTKEQKKILELKAQKKSLTEQKYRERQEKQALLAELEALRSQHSTQPDENDIDSIIEQRVQERIYQSKLAEQNASFDAACNKVYEEGIRDYPDFDDHLTSLSAVGMDRDTIEYIADSGLGHKILHLLANDLEEADRIMHLPVLKKAEALLKLKEEVSKQRKKISNSPEPIPSLGAKGSKVSVGDIANDYDSFNKWFETGLKNSR